MFDILSKIISKDDQRRIHRNMEKGMNIKAFKIHMEKDDWIKFFTNNHIAIKDFVTEVEQTQLSYKISKTLEMVTNDFKSETILTEVTLFGDKKEIDYFVNKNKEVLK